jgi:hypothetical protein
MEFSAGSPFSGLTDRRSAASAAERQGSPRSHAVRWHSRPASGASSGRRVPKTPRLALVSCSALLGGRAAE